MASPESATRCRAEVSVTAMTPSPSSGLLVGLFVGMESLAVVRSVAEGLVRRVAASAEREGVAGQRVVLAFTVDEPDRTLHEVRTIGPGRDRRFVHEDLLGQRSGSVRRSRVRPLGAWAIRARLSIRHETSGRWDGRVLRALTCAQGLS